jgi:2-polyprenyl-6-hydroxyphenyl methylase/3-demethylubiquinone-9 3-methyltransferase
MNQPDRHFVPPILKLVEQWKPRRLLDYGCGNGALCRCLKSHGVEKVIGMDPSETGINQAKNAAQDINFYNHSVYDRLPSEHEAVYDMVVSTEVVEHLYAPRALPQRLNQALRPGGIAIVTTPYHGYWKNLAICLLNKWDSHHTVFWDHGHIKFWSKATLQKLFQDEGFEFLSFQGLGRLPYLWMTMLMVFRKPEQEI